MSSSYKQMIYSCSVASRPDFSSSIIMHPRQRIPLAEQKCMECAGQLNSAAGRQWAPLCYQTVSSARASEIFFYYQIKSVKSQTAIFSMRGIHGFCTIFGSVANTFAYCALIKPKQLKPAAFLKTSFIPRLDYRQAK